MATPTASFDEVPAGRGHWRKLIPAIARIVAGNAALARCARRNKVTTRMIWESTLVSNEVGPVIFEALLPAALADGRYAAVPPPQVAGQGLDLIPAALERERSDISATKLVVTL